MKSREKIPDLYGFTEEQSYKLYLEPEFKELEEYRYQKLGVKESETILDSALKDSKWFEECEDSSEAMDNEKYRDVSLYSEVAVPFRSNEKKIKEFGSKISTSIISPLDYMLGFFKEKWGEVKVDKVVSFNLSKKWNKSRWKLDLRIKVPAKM